MLRTCCPSGAEGTGRCHLVAVGTAIFESSYKEFHPDPCELAPSTCLIRCHDAQEEGQLCQGVTKEEPKRRGRPRPPANGVINRGALHDCPKEGGPGYPAVVLQRCLDETNPGTPLPPASNHPPASYPVTTFKTTSETSQHTGVCLFPYLNPLPNNHELPNSSELFHQGAGLTNIHLRAAHTYLSLGLCFDLTMALEGVGHHFHELVQKKLRALSISLRYKTSAVFTTLLPVSMGYAYKFFGLSLLVPHPHIEASQLELKLQVRLLSLGLNSAVAPDWWRVLGA
ncbi:hypothetical protein QTO34_014010 [Cnephaeus nilssonii]|uniref:Uncharacterized protein n=1 Tax=Cnephaeus nilssonii TaxID=3371016 RepID=A0AA40LVM0_CNENI|nr:hypothetical protein QTO34_014010 [Eptesicus nilssonii]